MAELRVRAGLPPFQLPPEVVIEGFLHTGEFPIGKLCGRCGVSTDEVVVVVTECERASVHGSGGFTWGHLLVSLFAGIFVREQGVVAEYGRDKIYPLPLPLCQPCRKKLWTQKQIRRCLAAVPEYRLLLEKFPTAKVQLSAR
jgi:hypothetical protein